MTCPTQEELEADAARYRFLVATMQSAKGVASLEVNREFAYYEMPEPGEEVRLQWYPDTPVGFYLSAASTIDAAIDKAMKEQGK